MTAFVTFATFCSNLSKRLLSQGRSGQRKSAFAGEKSSGFEDFSSD
jgi:hypothetical protein